MSAKHTMSQARLNMDKADREERASLRKGSSAKELKHIQNVNNVEVADNIMKALKSLPASKRRKLEFEIRTQLRNEQSELQQLSKDLEKSHAEMAAKERELLIAKEAYQKKAKNADAKTQRMVS